jgi:hypothetical protein
MKRKTIYAVLISTLFLSALHFFLSCIYHYATSSSDVSGVFDLLTWSYPYRRDVAIVNLMIVFSGISASVIGYIVRLHEMATGE